MTRRVIVLPVILLLAWLAMPSSVYGGRGGLGISYSPPEQGADGQQDVRIASIAVPLVEAQPTVASQSVVLLSSSDYVIPSIANRSSISLTATGTFEFVVGATTVGANSTPCYNVWLDIGPNVPVAVRASSAPVYLTIRQFGR